MTGLPDWLEGRVTVTVAEASRLTGVAERTIDRMLREGVLVWSQPLGPRSQRYITVASLLFVFGVPSDESTGAPDVPTEEG